MITSKYRIWYDLYITLENDGSAKLHLPQAQIDRIELTGPDSQLFEVVSGYYPDPEVQIGGQTSFWIRFLGDYSQSKYLLKIKVVTSEPDVEDHEFALALADCNNQANTIVVDQSDDWLECDIILGDVFVTDNAELTISNIIGFGAGANLIIDQGAKVILDNGHLTKLVTPGGVV